MKGIPSPRLQLAQLPTPIQRLERLSGALGGPDIYVKRDDMTGVELSGNKVRKLEFVAAEALAKGADTLITCGGPQSNHARATAAVAARLGLRCHLVLGGPPEEMPEGNLFLDLLFGSVTSFLPGGGLLDLESEMERIAEKYEAEGAKPYIVPLGASNRIGSLGYVMAAGEIADQCRSESPAFDAIVVPAGSAGTLAGLAAGASLEGLPGTVCGVSVSFPAAWLHEKVERLCDELRKSCYPSLDPTAHRVRVFDGYIGEGYGRTTPEQLSFIRDVASLEGLLLDPVYTGKALFGLAQEIRKGTFRKGERILFIHTGGVFGLFPFREAFSKEVFARQPGEDRES